MVFLFCLDLIAELLVSHELVCVSDCWIMLAAEIYVLVAFHLTSLSFSCLALDFFGLVMFFFLAFVII